MNDNVISFHQTDVTVDDIVIEIPKGEEMLRCVQIASDYLKSLRLPDDTNNTLVELFGDVTSAANKNGYVEGFKMAAEIFGVKNT